MTRFRQLDILVELIELCKERTLDIRQQLLYYKASVYKQEMAASITARLEDLRLIAQLLDDEMAMEPFRDYDIRASEIGIFCAPGECSFSLRVSILLQEMEHNFQKLSQGVSSRSYEPEKESAFGVLVQKNHPKILALCIDGSRQQHFFEALKGQISEVV